MGGGRGGGGVGLRAVSLRNVYLLVCARVGACFWKGVRVSFWKGVRMNITVVKFWYFV